MPPAPDAEKEAEHRLMRNNLTIGAGLQLDIRYTDDRYCLYRVGSKRDIFWSGKGKHAEVSRWLEAYQDGIAEGEDRINQKWRETMAYILDTGIHDVHSKFAEGVTR